MDEETNSVDLELTTNKRHCLVYTLDDVTSSILDQPSKVTRPNIAPRGGLGRQVGTSDSLLSLPKIYTQMKRGRR